MTDFAAIRRRIQSKTPLADIAAKIGLTRQAVCMWPKVPMKYVMAVSDMTGIPAHELRPDAFKGHVVKKVSSAAASRLA